MNNDCGTCIEGSQMFLGTYGTCMSCKGTGKCNHVFEGETEFHGEQWDWTGTKKVPLERRKWCKNCGAFERTLLNNDGTAKYEPTITSFNW